MYSKNDNNACEAIDKKEGAAVVNAENIIQMPSGLIGISHANNFTLNECAIKKFKGFYILQSMDFQDLALLMQPINIQEEKYHNKEDLLEIIESIGMNQSTTCVMLVVSLHNEDDNKVLTVNTRAPIFIDVERNVGAQFVLSNQDYEIQRRIE